MSATQQSQAIQVANQLISISGQLMSLYQQMVALDAAWTDQGVATVLANMQTVPLNADGSLGTTPDGTPNVAHPINTATFLTFSRALSSNQLGQCKTILDGIVNYVGGQAVATQVGARAILNAAVGG